MDTPIERPHLATYSQIAAFADNVVPTWNNPYVQTHAWPSYTLRTEATVKIQNLSATTAAINGLVHFSTSAFGIGTAQQLRLAQPVNVAPRGEVVLLFPINGPAFAGGPGVGIHVRIEHPHDVYPLDNMGSNVVDSVATAGGRREFDVPIPVVNNFAEAREIQLSLLPTGLRASLSPSRHRFGPFEQIQAALHIEVPASLSGTPDEPRREEVTVVARAADTDELIGGATLLVRIVD